ncbi:hypothetical protein RB597_002581 [Gaeumannomyces tritici]
MSADTDATETTSLLAAGAGAGAGDGQRNSPEHAPASGNGATWAGYDAEFANRPKWRRPSVYWLLPPYFLFTLAFGGSLVPKINLIIELVCSRYLSDRSASDPTFIFAPVIPGGNNPQCKESPAIQSKVAAFNMLLNLVTGSLSAFTVPKIGALSDRYGRKHLLVVASCGGIVGETVMILAAKYPETVHYNWLILGAVVDGLAGSFTAGGVVSNSYTADCTPPSKRTVAIGYLYSCLYAGLALGPVLAGYMVEKWTHELVSVFYVTLACHVFFVLFILLVVPESVSRKRQLMAREKHAEVAAAARALADAAAVSSGSGPLGASFSRLSALAFSGTSPLEPLRALWPKGPGSSATLRRNIVFLAVIDTVLLGMAMGAGQVIIMYTGFQFGWTTLETSGFISMTSVIRVVVLVGVLPLINYIFRTRRRSATAVVSEKNAGADEVDLWVLRVAIMSDVLGVTGYLFSRSPAVFVASGAVTAMGGLGTATTQTALTKHVPPESVGSLLGAIGLLHGIARILAPLAIGGLYASTVAYFPQSPFVLLLATFAGILVIAFFVRPHSKFKHCHAPFFVLISYFSCLLTRHPTLKYIRRMRLNTPTLRLSGNGIAAIFLPRTKSYLSFSV